MWAILEEARFEDLDALKRAADAEEQRVCDIFADLDDAVSDADEKIGGRKVMVRHDGCLAS